MIYREWVKKGEMVVKLVWISLLVQDRYGGLDYDDKRRLIFFMGNAFWSKIIKTRWKI